LRSQGNRSCFWKQFNVEFWTIAYTSSSINNQFELILLPRWKEFFMETKPALSCFPKDIDSYLFWKHHKRNENGGKKILSLITVFTMHYEIKLYCVITEISPWIIFSLRVTELQKIIRQIEKYFSPTYDLILKVAANCQYALHTI